jgi:CRP/FNR family transcriptional regulator, cyclic AMP receptor protein
MRSTWTTVYDLDHTPASPPDPVIGRGMHDVRYATVGDAIRDLGQRRTYAPGEFLFVEGDRSHCVYLCVEGRVRLFLTTPSGRELLVGIKSPGDEFGELSALDGRPRSSTAAALDPTVVAEIRAARFMELLRDEPHLSLAVCQSLSAELRRANDRLVTRDSDSAVVRTGRMLIELASMKLRHGGPSGTFELALTQSDLAGWIGATRESTARALARFRRAGLVETGRGCIVVLDLVGLNQLVAAS